MCVFERRSFIMSDISDKNPDPERESTLLNPTENPEMDKIRDVM